MIAKPITREAWAEIWRQRAAMEAAKEEGRRRVRELDQERYALDGREVAARDEERYEHMERNDQWMKRVGVAPTADTRVVGLRGYGW